MPEQTISVLIPTHSRPKILKRTLDSLAECDLPSCFREVVVVENGSRNGAEVLTDELPGRLNARYLHVDWANKSYALNSALATMGDGLIFFTDDDVRFAPGILMAYASAMEDFRSGVFFGGPVDVDRQAHPPGWMEPLLPWSVRGYNLFTERMERGGYLGFNWAAYASDIREMGGFDPLYGPGSPIGASGQESDMQDRLFEAGYSEVDVMEAVVWHHVPEEHCNEKWLRNRFFRYGVSRGISSGGGREVLAELGIMVKYSVRWALYLALLNKTERKKSKMELISRTGYLYSVINRKSPSESSTE
ncbi:MAG: glycosyltransferase family 2 protein [Balneolaceae bacterium]